MSIVKDKDTKPVKGMKFKNGRKIVAGVVTVVIFSALFTSGCLAAESIDKNEEESKTNIVMEHFNDVVEPVEKMKVLEGIKLENIKVLKDEDNNIRLFVYLENSNCYRSVTEQRPETDLYLGASTYDKPYYIIVGPGSDYVDQFESLSDYFDLLDESQANSYYSPGELPELEESLKTAIENQNSLVLAN